LGTEPAPDGLDTKWLLGQPMKWG